ncbi:MAG TPA: isoprenylcysteine carboxylmethyltransferase family protein [Thermoanaerobaculia bacterium]|nr:isoprenylcysteine carboxylmethyltransferase family protein [Thermoanaerobaculia bacterium]
MPHGRLLAIVCIVWVASELAVMVLKHARGNASRRDRGSLRVLWAGISVATVGGSMLKRYEPTRIGYDTFWIGLGLIILGVIIRAIAIATLWRYFTVDVSIREGHELVDRGIYGVLRHPSYTGSLLSFLGLGFAFGNWLSVAIIAVATIIGFSYRIAVEEGALIEHFGDRYRDYMRRSKRLIPGIY